MRTIGVVSVNRSDYGIYLPILKRIQQDSELCLSLMVAGTHLSPHFGMTVDAIIEDGFSASERVEMVLSSDSPEGIAKSMGLGVMGFSQVFARGRPDILLVLGDRYEMLAAVAASLPFKIPLAHIHGGESTQGAMDEFVRHSITKMSHLHFASNELHARRIMQMGEEPWRVTVSGAPSLDNIGELTMTSAPDLEARYGIALDVPPLLVTYHPVTLEYERTADQMTEVLASLERAGLPAVLTYPNADTGNHVIVEMAERFVNRVPNSRLIVNMGTQDYFSIMQHAAAMVGNSSSGIIEAPSFGLPVVNVGNRQAGRVRARNVIDVECGRDAILTGIRQATSPQFKRSLSDLVNPYGDGHAAERIVRRLKTVCLDDNLIIKRFYDLPVATSDEAVGADPGGGSPVAATQAGKAPKRQ